MPLFSTIIPVHDREALIAATLDSALGQDWPDQEIIVVDDGSTDRTTQVVERYGTRVRLFRQPRSGPGKARNLGAQQAVGEYLAFLDSDDLWPPWTLSCHAEAIRVHGHPSLLAARLVSFSLEAEAGSVRRSPLRTEYFPDYLASSHRNIFVGAGMSVIRRDRFLAAGGFDARISVAEDHDLIFRLGTAPGFVSVLAPTTLLWRRHTGSASMHADASLAGHRHLLQQERAGLYPGGEERARERRALLARRLSSATMQLLAWGHPRAAMDLYRGCFRWNVRQCRIKYLLAFPMLAALAAVRRPGTWRTGSAAPTPTVGAR